MKMQITYRNVEDSLHQDLSEKMTALAKKLERHAAHFFPELVHLRVLLEKSSHHNNLHRVELRLSVPGRVLISEKVDDSFAAAAKEAFAELERQLIEHLERMRRGDEWRRKERRGQLHRLKTAATGGRLEKFLMFKKLVLPHLPVLRRFVRLELSHLRARGELGSDYPTVDDVVDEVLARAYRQVDHHPEPKEASKWLLKLAIEVAAEEAARSRKRGRMLSLEGPPPRDPTDISLDETLFDFYQPDDLLKVEDLAAAPSADPEEALTQQETRHHLASLLAVMPNKWRRAVMLTRLEDMPLRAVAQVLGASESEVREWLDRADAFLKARLSEVGIAPSDSGQPVGFIAPASLKDTPTLEAEFNQALEHSSRSS